MLVDNFPKRDFSIGVYGRGTVNESNIGLSARLPFKN